MAECYYSYTFDLEDAWITEEILDKNELSLRAVGLKSPIKFDDFIDAWKVTCRPIFMNEKDESRLSSYYFEKAYKRGERQFSIDIEHNPLKNTHATKYTRINIHMYEDEKTNRACVTVLWENNPELEKKIEGNICELR